MPSAPRRPGGLGLGLLNVQRSVQLYFGQAADYQTFMDRQTGLSLDLTIGSVGGAKDQFVLSNVDVWNPDTSTIPAPRATTWSAWNSWPVTTPLTSPRSP